MSSEKESADQMLYIMSRCYGTKRPTDLYRSTDQDWEPLLKEMNSNNFCSIDMISLLLLFYFDFFISMSQCLPGF